MQNEVQENQLLAFWPDEDGLRGCLMLLAAKEKCLKESCLFCAKFSWYCLYLLAHIFKKRESVILLLLHWPVISGHFGRAREQLTDGRQGSFTSTCLFHLNSCLLRGPCNYFAMVFFITN